MRRKNVLLLLFFLAIFMLPKNVIANEGADGGGITGGVVMSDRLDTVKLDEVVSISFTRSDMMYLGLYGDRPEDRERIERIVEIYNHAEMNLDLVESSVTQFFSHHIVLSLEGQRSASIALPQIVDSQIRNELESFFVYPQRMSLSHRNAQVGEVVHLSGEDGLGDHALQIFLIPIDSSIQQRGPKYEGANGLSYPHEKALYIGKVPVQHDRYDSSFEIPAFGEDVNGELQLIRPMTSNIIVDRYVSSTETELNIQRAERLLVAVDGKLLPSDTPPMIREGRSLIPVRAASEAFGAEVVWDGMTRSVLVNTPIDQAGLTGNVNLWVNGEKLEAEVPPVLDNGRVYVPARTISDALEFDIHYFQDIPLIHLEGFNH